MLYSFPHILPLKLKEKINADYEKNKIAIQEKSQKEEIELKRSAFEIDKAQRLVNITMSIAEAVTKALSFSLLAWIVVIVFKVKLGLLRLAY